MVLNPAFSAFPEAIFPKAGQLESAQAAADWTFLKAPVNIY